jgi:outer membrane autotransporter protein
VTDNSALLNFTYKKDGNTIDLDIVKASEKNIEDSISSAAGSTSTKKAAKTLQAIQDSGDYPAMKSVFTALNKLSTDEAVAKAVETTTPQSMGATMGATSQISSGITGIVEQRQNVTMGGGLNSGEEMFAQKNAWVKPFGSFGSQNDKDGLNGFDLKAYGIGMGIDGEYKPNQTLGFAFFYTAADVDVNNLSQNSEIDVFTTLLYGNMPVIDEKTKFMYQLGYAWQKTKGDRKLFNADTATSDYTSKTASLDLKLVRNYQVNDRLLLQPMVEATYRHFTSPSYSESGAGSLNLEVQKFTSTELIAGVGTIAYYKLNDDSRITGNINIGYDIHDSQKSVTASYQGASGVSFDTDGIDNGRWSYDVGAGYEMDINENSNINFSYNRQGQGSDFTNNTISAKYLLKF